MTGRGMLSISRKGGNGPMLKQKDKWIVQTAVLAAAAAVGAAVYLLLDCASRRRYCHRVVVDS